MFQILLLFSTLTLFIPIWDEKLMNIQILCKMEGPATTEPALYKPFLQGDPLRAVATGSCAAWPRTCFAWRLKQPELILSSSGAYLHGLPINESQLQSIRCLATSRYEPPELSSKSA